MILMQHKGVELVYVREPKRLCCTGVWMRLSYVKRDRTRLPKGFILAGQGGSPGRGSFLCSEVSGGQAR